MTVAKRPLAPEWVVSNRDDSGLDETLTGGWGVRPAPLLRGAPYTDFSEHVIGVPLGDTEAEQAVRLHEMIHAALSPSRVPHELIELLGVSKQAVTLAEEVRVNFVGALLYRDEETLGGSTIKLCDGSEMSLTDRICETEAWNDGLNLFLSTYNTDMFRKVKRRLRRVKHWREPLQEIERSLKNRGLSVLDHGYSYRTKATAKDTSPQAYQWTDKKGEHHTTILNSGFVGLTLSLAEHIDAWIANPPMPPGLVKKAPIGRDRVPRSDHWADLRMGTTRLTEPTTTFVGRRKRPAMTGKHPSRPDRLLTDPERRIFRETVKANGGVVVFDCSGSMGVTHETVRQAVKQFSGATVVVYSDNMRSGEVKPNAWVVARNGRMISAADFDDLPLHRGNGVDGPILRWALKNRKTRKDFVLWVSDGMVTGKGDSHSDDLLDEVTLLSQRNNIVGVDSCEEAVELLRRMKTTGSVPANTYCRVVKNHIATMKRRKK